jgi:hypothetical protein
MVLQKGIEFADEIFLWNGSHLLVGNFTILEE